MIYLLLAEPRTGKSQYAVKRLLDHKTEGKRVFVTNFKQTEEQRDASGFEDFPDPSKWWDEMPHGAVWLIDECQEVIPQRDKTTPLKDWVQQFSLHGHHDLTIYVITQDAMQIDVTLRRNCNFTLMLTRPLGAKRANVYTFRRYQERPNDAWRFSQMLKQAESKEVFKYSPKYQALYTSASAHEHIKRRIPKKLVLLPIIFLGAIGLIGWSISRLKNSADDETQPAAVQAVAGALTGAEAPSAAATPATRTVTIEEWIVQQTPRIEGVPSSAPMYDGFKVQDYPRPVCYISARFDECRCYTQQGSRMHMPQSNCRMIVENGWWDPYKTPDRSDVGVVAGQGGNSSDLGHADRSTAGSIMSAPQVGAYGDLGVSTSPASAP